MAGRALAAGVLVVVVALPAAGGSSATSEAVAPECTRRPPSRYIARVEAALRSSRDAWGEQLLAARGGPTYSAAAARLAPVFSARAPGGRALTRTGAAYLPLALPVPPTGAANAMLHVLDGSAVLFRRADGASLAVDVGAAGTERFGSCRARLESSALADGWLPILQTSYRDAHGGRYEQESFATRAGGQPGSYLRLVAAPAGPARVRVGAVDVAVRERDTATVHVRWLPPRAAVPVTEAEYADARASVVRYWRRKLAEGGAISVPEPLVQNASRALLVRALTHGWRYGFGNAYEQFSFPETIDMARTLGEHGFAEPAAAILRAALPARPNPYPNWKRGEKLLGAGAHWALYRDRRALDRATPSLRAFLGALERQLGADGLLPRERYSSDIPERVRGLHAQARVWQGLRAVGTAWAQSGRARLGRRALSLAADLAAGLRRAVTRSQRRLPDGSLFVPMRLLDGVAPYSHVTASRSGSYWNLVAPYAFASGLLPPGGPQARGVARYLRLHGTRLLGLVRTAAPVLYGAPGSPARSGVNPVYGHAEAHFLADLDEADRLVLSLYGQLAVGMTHGTFVGGEGTTVAPLGGVLARTTYLPPNAAAGAAFLQTLRLLLVHETESGLDLAFATPRAWLAPGKLVSVERIPTRFGPVSFRLNARERSLRVTVSIPTRRPPPRVRLRLRLPAGEQLGRIVPARPADARSQTIDLSGMRGTVELEIERRR